ncbi:20S-pre-rRNA D-site endonuclease nob1 [Friedmanniomyces endolithicus]|uniref:20S-pre-rRNA D-site endonuclease NOB1 n=1 Tax=Friedmanniomyces endolithicus TaxID=329885 RepID=A0A4U0UYG9_9PEZI|nr:20S-pre-rRNA D-site endonuclease nob1 [Friedmanniomyces endolithicus]KAK0291944.1 20S-pre-rRNA D-site endonuclease nob1 [Friedmanniomyces endolithicus]KAK0297858.1 20S-pre-rRNA D-site endonuclease nob1 [Friedmanniomyces endolithicus]KAK0305689.1 20S-pre-rRNA D-site endonuclease nob1 [Friedmanniomyces endolithicus]KAK0921436.1 20S-pre-rRNA D-site endonuclease nob1 [Friedmanniomyces endolithicus]
MDTSSKPVHTLVLDTGAIIKNEPPISSLIAQSESLVTVPAIISEIRDAATRSRVETTLLPFLTIRSPAPASIKVVTDFARKTGDLAVLSKPDIQIIALTYEIECERNSGDWRLRRVPGQKRLNGAPPVKTEADGADEETSPTNATNDPQGPQKLPATAAPWFHGEIPTSDRVSSEGTPVSADQLTVEALSETNEDVPSSVPAETDEQDLSAATKRMELSEESKDETLDVTPKVDSAHTSGASQSDSDSDSEGWITPSNLHKRQAEDASASTVQTPESKTMQVGVLTTDFAMQNVILQMNLNLLSPSMSRVKHLKTFVLRCHACFNVSKDMTKQFCPKCGQPSLTRVSCSTNANGEFKLHLKKNMQWNTRGDRYSVPKAVHGSAHGRIKGGGKGGWGNELILAEDQKEFERASRVEQRQKERSLMDEDYLPSILTGDRNRAGGRIKVGAGRGVNSKKR